MSRGDDSRAGYRAVGAALLRAVHHSEVRPPAWPDLVGTSPGHVTAWVEWLRRAWDVPEIADVVGHASPELDRQVRALRVADAPNDRRTRRAVLSVARYLRRMAGRPTPSGLLAGVAAARFGEAPHVRWGSEHSPVARAEADWLADVIGQLEGCPDVLERLLVVANSTATERGDRLIVPYQANPNGRVAGAMDVSLRYTLAVRAAMEAALRPVQFGDLATKLVGAFPSATREQVVGMLTELVARRALITNLHAPSTEPNALRWLLKRLAPAGTGTAAASVAELLAELKRVHDLLELHHQVPANRPRALREETAVRMRRLAGARRHPVTVDLRLDADVVLPEGVAREAERAARVLTRLSPHPHGTAAWRAFHRRFYQRFGSGALVPLLDVVADSGIGWPDGYPGTDRPERRPERSRRDDELVALAQVTALDGRAEVALNEALIAKLEVEEVGRVRLPPHMELCVRVNAADLGSLARGDFRLTVVSVSRAAGVMTGRFLSVLDPDDRKELATHLADLPGCEPDVVRAQVSFPPLDPASAHVARTVRVLPAVVSLAEHRDTAADDGLLTAEDLAVGCDSHRLYLAVPKWGKRLEVSAMHALNQRTHTPPVARFVTELTRAHCAQVSTFDWGAAGRLPFLPRLRYGRVVLASARWRVEAAELPGRAAGWEAWDAELAAWRHRRRLPRLVHLAEGDQRLPLDMDEAGHRVLLREHLHTHRDAVLEEADDETAAGWCGARAHEVVVPLAASQRRTWPTLPRPTPERVIGRGYGQTPGASRLLFAKLYGDAHRQNTVLAEHLPVLLAGWSEKQPVWWFLRFRDGDDHYLRLRITLSDARPATFGEAAARVSGWADELRQRGLLREVEYATSYPQTGRWGDGPALTAAQAVFAADSATVLTHLAQPQHPHPRALAAANFTAIVIAFTGSTAAGMDWLINHVPPTAPAPVARPVFAEAVRLADPGDGFHTLRGMPGGTAIANAWTERSRAITAYRDHLPGPYTKVIEPDDVLGSLLHTHFLRACGIEPEEKAVCLYLARAAALAYTARARKGDRR